LIENTSLKPEKNNQINLILTYIGLFNIKISVGQILVHALLKIKVSLWVWIIEGAFF
jgi:hypothetical protein